MSGYSKIESANSKSDHAMADLQIQKLKLGSEPKTDGTTEESETQKPRLNRNRSVNVFPTTVKRALSMRRSSSVSERYCRIHDRNSAAWPFPFQEEAEEEEEDGENKEKKKKRRSKFLKACSPSHAIFIITMEQKKISSSCSTTTDDFGG
ncbi:PREDICTED: uncharacterized protein LOC104809151 isoform X2 [Tarenaya hassleriana]|uniref:uncharacterized protein LOC104809151 isoform X2 n=1 Tax=Tarenaya hassleriana TaxID=28532 RepID=UPI00053C21A0|nr:PREDICTED: uncharacterized protein LOC104809151 isoform X2 [Tarenaya hassleriana]